MNDIETFIQGVLARIDTKKQPATCRHKVPQDYLCEICEGLTPSAEIVNFPPRARADAKGGSSS